MRRSRPTRREDMTLSNTPTESIESGDIWWVNFPFEEEAQLDDNNDSTMGKNRPCLVLGAIEGEEDRPFLVVKGTTSHSRYVNDANIECVGNLRLDCSKLASLSAHHFISKEAHIDFFGEDFERVMDKVQENYKDNNVVISTYEQAVIEGYYKSKYEQCKMVYDSLSDEEKKYMGGHYVDSPALVYRKVAQNKDTKEAVGYIELYDSAKLGQAQGDVNLSVAVHPNWRGQDLATAMIKGAIHWFKGTEYKTMSYITHIDNVGSRRLAEKCGFVFIKQDNRRKEIIHMITNPNRLKAIGEEMEQMVKEMSGGSGIVGMEINDVSVQTSSPGMFIIGYGEHNNFVGDGGDNSGYAIANDIFTKHIFRRKNGKTVKEDFSFLNDRQITIYEYKGEPIRFYLLLKEAELGIVDENTDDMTYFYEALSGNTMICEDQIDYDDKFACWNTVRELANLRTSEITMEEEFNKLIGKENYSFPVISNEDLELENDLRKLKDSYRLYEDIKGYYVFDEDTNLRTVSMSRKMIQAMTI